MCTNSDLLDDITEISRGRTVINAVANYGQYAVSMAVGIFLQAYIIRTLGRNEYAIWPLVITCISFVGLIQVGIGSGAGRFLAHALGRKDLKEVEQITTSLFAALLAAAVVFMMAIVFVSIYFEKIFDIPEGAQGIGLWAMLLAGLSGAVALPFGVFGGGLIAAQKFVILNILRIIFLVARLILIILAFTLALPSLIWIAGIDLALSIAQGIIVCMVARRIVSWQRVRWSAFSWDVLKKTHGYSLLVLVTTIAGLLYWKTDNIIINKLLEPSLLTGYAVVVNFVLYSYQVTSMGLGVLSPAATIMHAKGELSRMSRLIYRVNRTVVPLSVSILFFLIIFGREVLEVYLGSGYGEFAILFPILGTSAILSVTQNSSSLVPHAFGRMLTVSIMSLAVAILNILLSLFFVLLLNWGLVGVAAGTAIVTVVHKTVFWPWYAARLLQVSWGRYFRNSILIPLSNSLPFITIILAMRLINFGKGWSGLITVFMVGGLTQAIYMLIYGLERNDRLKVRELVLKSLSSVKLILKPDNL